MLDIADILVFEYRCVELMDVSASFRARLFAYTTGIPPDTRLKHFLCMAKDKCADAIKIALHQALSGSTPAHFWIDCMHLCWQTARVWQISMTDLSEMWGVAYATARHLYSIPISSAINDARWWVVIYDTSASLDQKKEWQCWLYQKILRGVDFDPLCDEWTLSH